MRISDWSSDVCSSDLRRRDSPGGSCVIGRQIAAGEQRSAGDQGDERLGHFEDPCSVVPSSVVWPLSPDEVSSCGVARSSCPCLNRRQTTTKNIGTKKKIGRAHV